jgi:hypothetical protein
MLTPSIFISETNHEIIKAYAEKTGVSFSQAIVTLALQALPDKEYAAFAAAVGESVRHVVRDSVQPLQTTLNQAFIEAAMTRILTEEIVRFWLREAARQSVTTDEFIAAHLLSMAHVTFTDYERAVQEMGFWE